MSKQLRIAIAQLNLKVGDIKSNTAKIIDYAKRAQKENKADIIVYPELTITSYPPEDLLLRADFHAEVEDALKKITSEIHDIDMVIGHPHKTEEGIYNAASVYQNGELALRYYKQYRPNYSVFDEKRYFISGTEAGNFTKNGITIGVVICEDLWREAPAAKAKESGSQILLSLNASPFHVNKPRERERIMQKRALEHQLPIIYVHCVGGQDTLVFDGGSMAIDAAGEVCQRCSFYEERLSMVECNLTDQGISINPTAMTELPSEEASIYSALRLGVKDYVEKNGFSGVFIGLSGGIDSALTLAIAVDALGRDQVEAVMMPSRFTTEMSLRDAKSLADNLGVRYHEISIQSAFEAFIDMLAGEFSQLQPDVTEENIQARCRAIVLMALANKHQKMVLTTGNKSEMAMGYATLYGDMAGGFGVLGDVYKTWVYRLAHYRNQITPVIPTNILTRAPSAELRDNQTDQDTLPPYNILDEILYMFVEDDKAVSDIIAAGFDEKLVRTIIRDVNMNEHKRRQAPPCVRISKRAFGRDRRYPITSGYLPS
jgi:NAD+ synthase (glutamine-hydrolysing)